ncbi:MAG: hypothetical protein R3F62_31935, partial [Planctomycetota bacterium]
EALDAICERAGLWSRREGDRVLLRPREETLLHARGVDVRHWLQALAAQAQADLVVGSGVGGPVELDLRDVSYDAAIVATVNALGLILVREPSGVLRVQAAGEPAPSGPTQVRQPTQVGDLSLRLEALVLGASGRLAVIGGSVYRLGESLRDSLGDPLESYRVEAIERDRVVILDSRDPTQERRHVLRF